MPKTPPKERPAWLDQKLSRDHQTLIRTNVGSFLDHWQRLNGAFSDAKHMLPNFFRFLGEKSEDFKQVRKADICVNDKGTHYAYDCIRRTLIFRASRPKAKGRKQEPNSFDPENLVHREWHE